MKYKIKENILWKIVDDEAVIVNNDEEIYSYLNPTGTEIWKMISESMTLEEIQEKLNESYDSSSEEIKKDIDEIISELVEQSLIEQE